MLLYIDTIGAFGTDAGFASCFTG